MLWIWIAAAYFVFGLSGWRTHRKFLRLFAENFPTESRNYFDDNTSRGKWIAGLYILWDSEIGGLIINHRELVKYRNLSRIFLLVFLLVLFFSPEIVIAAAVFITSL